MVLSTSAEVLACGKKHRRWEELEPPHLAIGNDDWFEALFNPTWTCHPVNFIVSQEETRTRNKQIEPRRHFDEQGMTTENSVSKGIYQWTSENIERTR